MNRALTGNEVKSLVSGLPPKTGLKFDISSLTLADVDTAYERTLSTLERLSKLREAVAAQEYRRIEQLIKEFHDTKQAAKEPQDAVTTGSDPDPSPVRRDGP